MNSEKSINKMKFEIKIPQIQERIPKAEINIIIKREPKKNPQEYLEILAKLKHFLENHSLTDTQRAEFCKSQRYFMKLYLDKIKRT